MNYRAVYILCFSLSFLISNAQKKGLIIGIGTYPQESKWPSLSSENDIKYVQASLIKLGFIKNEIDIIKNHEATKVNILEAFKRLEQKAQKDDFVYIHYSGHGQQVVDNNHEEIDRLDEAIVPYDSPLNFKKGIYEGENLIRDDEINVLTRSIRSKLGPKGQLILVLDACHSGTGTRGKGTARGSNLIMGESQIVSETSIGFEYGLNDDNKSLAPMASFFGSSAQELNYETLDPNYNAVGSLTYAMSDVLSNLKSKCTFQELFEKIKNKMIKTVPNQNPKWEGPKDVILFENSKVNLDKWINVKNRINETNIIIETGTLNGVFKGSTVEIYDMSSKRKLTTGKVINSQLLTSVVLLKTEIAITSDQILKCKVLQTISPPCRVNLNNQISKDASWNAITNNLERTEICSITNNEADLYLANCGTGDNKIQLTTKEGDVLYEGSNPKNQSKHTYRLNQAIKEYALGQFIRNYEFKNSAYNFEVEVVPMEVEKKNRKVVSQNEISSSLKMGADGFLCFKNGDYIKIVVKNKGSKAGYFSILDIQGDNKINIVIPNTINSLTSEDYYLKPGESYETNFPIRIAPPFGTEVIKVIASDIALDLNNALGGSITRGIDTYHPFTEILNNISSKSRSADTQIEINQLGTNDFVFKIIN